LLDKALNEKLVDEVRSHGTGNTQFIRFASNGEPLIHPDIFDMLDYAKRKSGVAITLTTNGTLMNESCIEKLISIGVDTIDISIDAFSLETYAKIRLKADLFVTRKNVLELIKYSKANGSQTKVVVSYIEQPQNIRETEDFKKFWEDNGADYVVIRRMHSCSGAKSDLALKRRENNKGIVRRPCLYPWERIVLNAKGDLAYCPSDWVHGSYIADYRKVTIKETWSGEFYKELRRSHQVNNYEKIKFCQQCPDWEATRWPEDGRSYANMMEEFRTLK
jgi:MoaA/NifB/PqqE/SkfB family radical SAM enzyme